LKAEIKTEIIRKSLHILILFVLLLAHWHYLFTLILLAAGTAAYAVFELLRCKGMKIPVISAVTKAAERERDRGRYILGPVTLGAGALISLLAFPPPVAACAILALGLGDSVSSLVGKSIGRFRPGFLRGKSVEGSLACFAAVFFSAWAVLSRSDGLAAGPLALALAAACAATIAEGSPLKDWDNIVIPLATGGAVLAALLIAR
jgi:dolichol kinase